MLRSDVSGDEWAPVTSNSRRAGRTRRGSEDGLILHVEAEVAGGTSLSGESVEHLDNAVGVDRSCGLDGEALPRALVDHVQELEHPPVTRLVELEVEGPHHVRVQRAERPDHLADAPERLLVFAVRHSQAFLAPQAVDPLLVDARPPGGSRLGVGTSPAPTRPAPGEVTEKGPQSELLVGRHRCFCALGGARLADDTARSSLGDPEPLLQDLDGPAAAVRG